MLKNIGALIFFGGGGGGIAFSILSMMGGGTDRIKQLCADVSKGMEMEVALFGRTSVFCEKKGVLNRGVESVIRDLWPRNEIVKEYGSSQL